MKASHAMTRTAASNADDPTDHPVQIASIADVVMATVTMRLRPKRCDISLPKIETTIPTKPATVKRTVGVGSHAGRAGSRHREGEKGNAPCPQPGHLPGVERISGNPGHRGAITKHGPEVEQRTRARARPTSRFRRLYGLPCSDDFAPGRGGLLQLLSMSLSPCCRFHPADVNIRIGQSSAAHAAFALRLKARPSGILIFEATTRLPLLRPGDS